MALSVALREGESVALDDGKIVIAANRVGDSRVTLSIQAPRSVQIGRPYQTLKAPEQGKKGLKPP